MKLELDYSAALLFAVLYLLIGMTIGAGVRDCQHGGAPSEQRGRP